MRFLCHLGRMPRGRDTVPMTGYKNEFTGATPIFTTAHAAQKHFVKHSIAGRHLPTVYKSERNERLLWNEECVLCVCCCK
jgi:hypothetical protein